MFNLIHKHNLFNSIQDKIIMLMEFDKEVSVVCTDYFFACFGSRIVAASAVELLYNLLRRVHWRTFWIDQSIERSEQIWATLYCRID